MTAIAFILFWIPIIFALMIGASYIGTKFALQSYFEDKDPPSDFIGLEDKRK
ncbi:hypothetical protein [Haloquadratum walsbyi]|uniref:hypothetical protein n=1 Tax=Haloquadratum walsbyi TaxID=293091 RepID=UPI000AEBAD15|nr:hypothetical protein [Haloquadratum walsbyi]